MAQPHLDQKKKKKGKLGRVKTEEATNSVRIST